MGLADIREQIKAVLSGVSGIGAVHDYERWAIDWQKFLNVVKDENDRINAWMFALAKTQKIQRTHGQYERAYIFRFRGIMGLKDADATGIVFENLVLSVENEFDSYETLNDTCMTINPDWGDMAGMLGYQTDIIEPRQFGNVLCHVSEGRLCAIEFIDI